MIECSKSELAEKKFEFREGFLFGVLLSENLYAIYRSPDEKVFLAMKICGDVYSPHRARDIGGKDYGETELSSGALGDLEKIEDLIAVLGGKSS
jgi:hypothetical protein